MVPRIEKVFDSPDPQPNGLQATPNGLWILDQSTNRAERLSYRGEVLKTLQTSSDRGSGVTESRDGLWIASTYSGEIHLVDPSNGATLAAFPTPGGAKTGAHGLESRDGKLWVVVPSSRTIYHVDENFDPYPSDPRTWKPPSWNRLGRERPLVL